MELLDVGKEPGIVLSGEQFSADAIQGCFKGSKDIQRLSLTESGNDAVHVYNSCTATVAEPRSHVSVTAEPRKANWKTGSAKLNFPHVRVKVDDDDDEHNHLESLRSGTFGNRIYNAFARCLYLA